MVVPDDDAGDRGDHSRLEHLPRMDDRGRQGSDTDRLNSDDAVSGVEENDEEVLAGPVVDPGLEHRIRLSRTAHFGRTLAAVTAALEFGHVHGGHLPRKRKGLAAFALSPGKMERAIERDRGGPDSACRIPPKETLNPARRASEP